MSGNDLNFEAELKYIDDISNDIYYKHIILFHETLWVTLHMIKF